MYTTDAYHFTLRTATPKGQYFERGVAKFATFQANAANIASFDEALRASDAQLFIWPRSPRIKPKCTRFFADKVPLYACFGHDYVVLTPIITAQLAAANFEGSLLDLALKEMGAVLIEGPDIFDPHVKVHRTLLPAIAALYIQPRMHGWFGRNTELYLQHAIQAYAPRVIVELGSWLGKSSAFIAQTMRADATLYCFDKFQNIAASPYKFDEPSPIDQFYFGTPRFETFCVNVSNPSCVPVKHDVMDFIAVMRTLGVVPDLVFIDAVKKTTHLVRLLRDIFTYAPEAVVIGDDNIFPSVRRAVGLFMRDTPWAKHVATEECYLLIVSKKHVLSKRALSKRALHEGETRYDVLIRQMYHGDQDGAIRTLRGGLPFDSSGPAPLDVGHAIDINKPLARVNDCTAYTLAAALMRSDPRVDMSRVMSVMMEQQKPMAIKNALGLTFKDYMSWAGPPLLH